MRLLQSVGRGKAAGLAEECSVAEGRGPVVRAEEVVELEALQEMAAVDWVQVQMEVETVAAMAEEAGSISGRMDLLGVPLRPHTLEL